MGCEVTVFEALHAAGGVRARGIPGVPFGRRRRKAETGAGDDPVLRSSSWNWALAGRPSETIDEPFGDGFEANFLVGSGAGLLTLSVFPRECNGVYLQTST